MLFYIITIYLKNLNHMKQKLECLATAGIFAFLLAGCSSPGDEQSREMQQASGDSTARALMSDEELIKRGEYLVTIAGCDDCHSPKIMTDKGPQFDMSRRLSGHPADSKLAAVDPADIAPGKWFLAAQDLTAWAGPWGVSFAANLSPDSSTGTGAWTEELFFKIIRTGYHMGIEGGRRILPPMPWENFAKMKDEDLKAIFTFIKSLPPIKNKVPDPLPPSGSPS
jgi:hypothetical protein